jgi:leucyl-tRNA synthetase
MHRGLVERYIEMSTLLLVPITPHTSEHVWTNLLKKQGSVLTAGASQEGSRRAASDMRPR